MKRILVIPKGVLVVGVPRIDLGTYGCMVYIERPHAEDFCLGLDCDDCVFGCNNYEEGVHIDNYVFVHEEVVE